MNFLFIILLFVSAWADDLARIDSAPSIEQQRFEQFIKRVMEKKKDTQAKITILEDISKGGDAAFRTAYLMYYNVEADLVGYPHLKLVMNGKVYEIHRIPNKDGTFLRERELYKGLLDARRGYLPSGIVSFPMTPEQSEKLTKFLIEEGSSSMKYAYFNKLFSKDTYNCGGILYEGLLKAGYKIPVMTRWNSMLPGQLFRRAYKNIPEARLVGVGKTWREEFVKPNWGTKSIPQRLPEKPKVSNNDCVLNGLQRLLNQ